MYPTDPAPAPTLATFTLKATGIDGLSADVPADIDEANATITLSINADPAKRANWTAVSTSQITTTYTGASLTPSSATLDLSNDNNNVATYTVTNADGKSKVYTLKIEFASFKVNIDQNGLEGVSTYGIEVYYTYTGAFVELSQTNNIRDQNITQKTYTYSDYLATGTKTTYAVLYFKNAQGDVLSERLVKINDISSKTVTVTASMLTGNYVIAYLDFSVFNSPTYGYGTSSAKCLIQFMNPSLNDGYSSMGGVYNTMYGATFWAIIDLTLDPTRTSVRARLLLSSVPKTVDTFPDGAKTIDFTVHKVNKLSFTATN